MVHRKFYQIHGVIYPQFFHDSLPVGDHRLVTDKQFLGDGLIIFKLDYQGEYLAFPSRQFLAQQKPVFQQLFAVRYFLLRYSIKLWCQSQTFCHICFTTHDGFNAVHELKHMVRF